MHCIILPLLVDSVQSPRISSSGPRGCWSSLTRRHHLRCLSRHNVLLSSHGCPATEEDRRWRPLRYGALQGRWRWARHHTRQGCVHAARHARPVLIVLVCRNPPVDLVPVVVGILATCRAEKCSWHADSLFTYFGMNYYNNVKESFGTTAVPWVRSKPD